MGRDRMKSTGYYWECIFPSLDGRGQDEKRRILFGGVFSPPWMGRDRTKSAGYCLGVYFPLPGWEGTKGRVMK